jgi:hypothetical protein
MHAEPTTRNRTVGGRWPARSGTERRSPRSWPRCGTSSRLGNRRSWIVSPMSDRSLGLVAAGSRRSLRGACGLYGRRRRSVREITMIAQVATGECWSAGASGNGAPGRRTAATGNVHCQIMGEPRSPLEPGRWDRWLPSSPAPPYGGLAHALGAFPSMSWPMSWGTRRSLSQRTSTATLWLASGGGRLMRFPRPCMGCEFTDLPDG